MEADSSFQQRLVQIMNERTSCSTAVEIAKKLKVENQIYNATYFPYSKFASRTAFVIPGEVNTPCAEWVREAIILEDVYNDNVQDVGLKAFLKQYGKDLANAFELIHANRIVNASNLVNDLTLGPFLKQIIARADGVASNISSIRQKIDQLQTAAGSSSTSTVLASALPSSIGANPGIDPARVKLNTSGPLVFQKEWLNQDDPVWNDLKAVQKANAEKATKSQKNLQFMPVPDQPLMVQLRVMNANRQVEAINSENQQTAWNQALLGELQQVAKMTASQPNPKNSMSLDDFDCDVLFPLRLQNAKQIPSYASQDPLGRVTGVNASVWFQLFGYDPASAIKTTGYLWDSDPFFKALKVIYTALFGDDWSTALLMTAKDGIRASMWSCRFDYALKYVALIRQWAEDFGQLSHAINGQSADEFLQETMMLVASTSPATVHGKKQILDLFQLSGTGQKANFHQKMRQWLEEACDYLSSADSDGRLVHSQKRLSGVELSSQSLISSSQEQVLIERMRPGRPIPHFYRNLLILRKFSDILDKHDKCIQKYSYQRDKLIKDCVDALVDACRQLGMDDAGSRRVSLLYLLNRQVLDVNSASPTSLYEDLLRELATRNSWSDADIFQNFLTIGDKDFAFDGETKLEAEGVESLLTTLKKGKRTVSRIVSELKNPSFSLPQYTMNCSMTNNELALVTARRLLLKALAEINRHFEKRYMQLTPRQLAFLVNGLLTNPSSAVRRAVSVWDKIYFENEVYAEAARGALQRWNIWLRQGKPKGYATGISNDGVFSNSCYICSSIPIKDAYLQHVRNYMVDSDRSQLDLLNKFADNGVFLAGNMLQTYGYDDWISRYLCVNPVWLADKVTIPDRYLVFYPITYHFNIPNCHFQSLVVGVEPLLNLKATSEQILNLTADHPWPREQNLSKEQRTKNPLWIRWFMDSARANPQQTAAQGGASVTKTPPVSSESSSQTQVP